MDRAVYEELSAKKAQLCEKIQTAEASRPPQDARLRSSGIRGCFPQPVCVEATTVSEATMVGEALRWVERKEEEAKEDKEWVREKPSHSGEREGYGGGGLGGHGARDPEGAGGGVDRRFDEGASVKRGLSLQLFVQQGEHPLRSD